MGQEVVGFCLCLSALKLSDPSEEKASLSHTLILPYEFSFAHSLMPGIPSTGKASHVKRKRVTEKVSRTSNI